MIPRKVEELTNLIKPVQTKTQLQQAYEAMVHVFLAPFENSLTKPKSRRYRHFWTAELDAKAKQRSRAYKKAVTTNFDQDWQEFKLLEKQVKRGARREKIATNTL